MPLCARKRAGSCHRAFLTCAACVHMSPTLLIKKHGCVPCFCNALIEKQKRVPCRPRSGKSHRAVALHGFEAVFPVTRRPQRSPQNNVMPLRVGSGQSLAAGMQKCRETRDEPPWTGKPWSLYGHNRTIAWNGCLGLLFENIRPCTCACCSAGCQLHGGWLHGLLNLSAACTTPTRPPCWCVKPSRYHRAAACSLA